MMAHPEISGAIPDDVDVLNLEDFGEDADTPHACFPIAGLQYYDYDKMDDLIGRIRPARGDRLLLVRQPDNPYDGNAVEVRWRNGRLLLGHLPRKIAAQIAPMLDAGSAVRCFAMNSGTGAGWSVWVLLASSRLPENRNLRTQEVV